MKIILIIMSLFIISTKTKSSQDAKSQIEKIRQEAQLIIEGFEKASNDPVLLEDLTKGLKEEFDKTVTKDYYLKCMTSFNPKAPNGITKEVMECYCNYIAYIDAGKDSKDIIEDCKAKQETKEDIN